MSRNFLNQDFGSEEEEEEDDDFNPVPEQGSDNEANVSKDNLIIC